METILHHCFPPEFLGRIDQIIRFEALGEGAMEAIASANILTEEEQRGARKTLKAAALTYVAATAVALAQLVRLLLVFGRRSRD